MKRVPDGKKLLTKNQILVNGKKENAENINNLLYQKPNGTILGYRLRLNMYNLANLKHDSTYQAKFTSNPNKYRRMSKFLSAKQVNRLGQSFWYAGIHNFLRDTGEPPVIIDTSSTRKSVKRLKSWYFNNGYFNAKAGFKIDTLAPKKARINYLVTTGNAFFLDTIRTSIQTPALDSMYQSRKTASFLKTGKQYKTEDFESERGRVTTHFRNNGVYNFQQNYINFDIDTLNGNFKANVDMKINNYTYREGDSAKTEPFKIYKISEVNIFTDYDPKKGKEITADTLKRVYKDFNLISHSKLKYRPKAITDAVFINKGNLFADFRTTLTTRYLSNLRIFNYPTIQYEVDKRDTISNSLIANIYLTPRDKYSFGYSLDFTHSNIQDFGISGTTSFSIRNVFNGAETFDISARGNIGSSRDLANPDDTFFNVLEYGVDMKLNFPRIYFPLGFLFDTDKVIPKNMIPSTTVSFGFAKQENIGLDKENFTGAMTYNWTPKRNSSARFDLFNIQYVKNINVANYFKVYKSSYKTLSTLANVYNADASYFEPGTNDLKIDEGTDGFINDVLAGNIAMDASDLKTVNNISQRRARLTENNLIFASSFTFSKTTKSDINDESFYAFKTKVEAAGNTLSLIASASKTLENQNGNNTIFEVEYSQYAKGEIEYIKHWDLRRKKVLAFRSFVGIAIPYGNSNSIPFSRSYFAGGSNDNRAWQAYSLGPGSVASLNDFNEANLKIAVSTEFRFNIFGQFNGALFADAGNIWNVLDNIEDEKAVFSGIQSLEDTALGTGFGFRYDFNFFVIRLDFGFKTYNPADTGNKKWLRDYNFGNSVVNIGINYPF
ncbi:BamA/TamA family outer membrane protein [Flavobacterium sp.]|uniref:translocation and assembly module lipoprotein TamL n=1 Tax=Flavobacterium sp. TaxID=239 RepID=UPI0039E6BD9D